MQRKNVFQKVNHELILTYWLIGKEIVETEQKNNIDNQTSRQIILQLSKQLTNEIGKGFSRSNFIQHEEVLYRVSRCPVADWTPYLDSY